MENNQLQNDKSISFKANLSDISRVILKVVDTIDSGICVSIGFDGTDFADDVTTIRLSSKSIGISLEDLNNEKERI